MLCGGGTLASGNLTCARRMLPKVSTNTLLHSHAAHVSWLCSGMNQGPRTLSYNPAENSVLITSDVDGGIFELYTIPKDTRGENAPVSRAVSASELRHYSYWCCTHVSRALVWREGRCEW